MDIMYAINSIITDDVVKFIGTFDIVCVILHLLTNKSIWSQYDITTDFLYFLTLIGGIRIYMLSCFITKATFYMEAIYFLNKRSFLSWAVTLFVAKII